MDRYHKALMSQYATEIRILADKLDKLDQEMDVIFPFDAVVDVIYHLEDAEKILHNMIREFQGE